jgi:hypothetical protein
MSDDSEPSEDEAELSRVRESVDDLRTGSPTPRPRRPDRVEPEALPAETRERITEALDDVAYVQHAYESRGHHVCHVGVRGEGTIEEDVVVAGPEGVARLAEVQERVDELRRGADPSDVAGLLTA